jgi:hypothetical protein
VDLFDRRWVRRQHRAATPGPAECRDSTSDP